MAVAVAVVVRTVPGGPLYRPPIAADDLQNKHPEKITVYRTSHFAKCLFSGQTKRLRLSWEPTESGAGRGCIEPRTDTARSAAVEGDGWSHGAMRALLDLKL